MVEQNTPPVRQRVAAYRARLRRQGLRPVQIWVPDVRAPGFAAEAHRQSALAAASLHEAEDQAFVDAISWFGDEGDDEDGE
jgi:DNA-binding LacI/PurR family transcriptional regulator